MHWKLLNRSINTPETYYHKSPLQWWESGTSPEGHCIARCDKRTLLWSRNVSRKGPCWEGLSHYSIHLPWKWEHPHSQSQNKLQNLLGNLPNLHLESFDLQPPWFAQWTGEMALQVQHNTWVCSCIVSGGWYIFYNFQFCWWNTVWIWYDLKNMCKWLQLHLLWYQEIYI